jgi:hypothetical protein
MTYLPDPALETTLEQGIKSLVAAFSKTQLDYLGSHRLLRVRRYRSSTGLGPHTELRTGIA